LPAKGGEKSQRRKKGKLFGTQKREVGKGRGCTSYNLGERQNGRAEDAKGKKLVGPLAIISWD